MNFNKKDTKENIRKVFVILLKTSNMADVRTRTTSFIPRYYDNFKSIYLLLKGSMSSNNIGVKNTKRAWLKRKRKQFSGKIKTKYILRTNYHLRSDCDNSEINL